MCENQQTSASDCQWTLHQRTPSVRSLSCSSPRSLSPASEPEWSYPTFSSPPQTVLLCLWPHATNDQIQHYIQGYESLYPSANLIPLRYSSSYDEKLRHTLDLLTVDQHEQPHQSILLHLFGDDSAAQACRLLRTYKIRTGEALGVKAVIMDSAPKLHIPTLRSALRMSREVPVLLAALLMILFYNTVWALSFWHTPDSICQNHYDLNDASLIPADARKCYIFTASNLMFSWSDRAARDEGELVRQDYAIRRNSVDEKGRWTGDQERYWLGIESAWDGR